MALSVSKLRVEYNTRTWARIIERTPYIAVLQLTAGGNWGRSNLKHRLLAAAERSHRDSVDARFAVPRWARAGAERTRFAAMSALFRAAPCAVVYGDSAPAVAQVVRGADKVLRDAVLVGGRFGEALVHPAAWQRAVELAVPQAGAVDTHVELLGVLDNAGSLLRTVDAAGGARGLAGVLREAALTRVVRVLDVHAKGLAEQA